MRRRRKAEEVTRRRRAVEVAWPSEGMSFARNPLRPKAQERKQIVFRTIGEDAVRRPPSTLPSAEELLGPERNEFPELGALGRLTPFSPVAIRLLRTFDSDDVNFRGVVDLISSDAAVSSELLATVNSLLFGPPMRIADPGQAVTIPGIEHTRALVTTLAMRSLMDGAPNLMRRSCAACGSTA